MLLRLLSLSIPMIHVVKDKLMLQFLASNAKTGFLLEAGSRVPAPVYFEQSARLLKVPNFKTKNRKK